jgi:hypothetical protein
MTGSRGLSLVLVVLGCASQACGARSFEPPAATPQSSVQAKAPASDVAVARAEPASYAPAKKDDSDEAPANAAAPPPAPPPPPPAGATTPVAVAKGDPAAEVSRDPTLMVYSAQLTLAVYKVDESLASVEKIAREHGGFVAKRQDREIVVRVPRAKFQNVVSGIDKVGDVLHRAIEAVDVTEEHVDLEIRIKNARAMQARLKELLAKANVKEALEIEKEMHRVTGELELLEGKLKVLRDKIAYSTIAVSFQDRAPSGIAMTPRLPFPWLANLGLPSLLSLTEEK